MSLPVRERSPRPGGGRHRRPVPTSLPPDAPVLVLVNPGDGGDLAAEIAALVRVDNPHIEVRLATLHDLADQLPQDRGAIVVPLTLWSDPRVAEEIAKIVAATGAEATVTDALGPHPLLAEALHIKLAEKELARADRMRLLSVSSPVDAVILGTVGGEQAVHAAQATAVLLASRLTLPVVAASLDSDPGVAVAAERLRAAGAARLAISPCLIGHESGAATLESAAASVGAGYAEPLGAHGAVAELVARAYGSQLAT
ncbi:sirohydrochlorin chelatase [Nonomuraea sp. NPDC059194]|uniref:sirohydrochlorin chelatase n=1 Tax=Nonomuraea sp. NPDC059194 TaxID=3346764 RepID=UPI0036A1CD9D